MGSGGVESTVMNHYRAIDRERIQFDFVVTAGSTRVPLEEIVGLGGRVFTIPEYRAPVHYFRALQDVLRAEQPPILHAHVNALSVLPLSAARAAGIPVRIAHSHSTSSPGEPVRNAIKGVLRRATRRVPTAYAACSDHAARWLFGDSIADSGQVRQVRNAIDIERFRFSESARARVRDALGLDAGMLAVGNVGRLSTQKNQTFLLEAFAALVQRRPQAVLLLVGEGELERTLLTRARELGIEASVRFLGVRADTSDLYCAMDVLAFPSLYEGLGMVVLEAQAASLPAVVSAAVPAEATIDPGLVRTLPLDASPVDWARAIDEAASTIRPREGIGAALADAGYDVWQSAADLADWYERLAEEAAASG